MHPEEIFDTLEILVDKLPFNLPHHEDGGRVYPFAWNTNNQGQFNVLNLCQYNDWIKSSDVDTVINQWHDLSYVKSFNGGSFDGLEIGGWQEGIKSLALAIGSLNNLQAYNFRIKNGFHLQDGIIIGQTSDGIWLGITSTVYVSSGIPEDRISYSQIEQLPLKIEINRPIEEQKSTATSLMPKSPAAKVASNKKYTSLLGESHVISQVEEIIQDRLKNIFINADFADYGCSHDYKMVFGVGDSLESAWNQTLQASGMLKIAKFNRLYTRNDELIEHYYCDYEDEEVDDIFSRYQKITEILTKELSTATVYRLSSWVSENIYITGDINGGDEGNKLGIYIKSIFVYNP